MGLALKQGVEMVEVRVRSEDTVGAGVTVRWRRNIMLD